VHAIAVGAQPGRRQSQARRSGNSAPPPRSGPPQRPPQPAPRKTPTLPLSWQAADPNGDQLRFRVEYRATDETVWKELLEKTETPSHQWDTESVPDGEYVIRVIASDAPDNPPDIALGGDKVSEPFVVDNARPAVTGLQAVRLADRGEWRVTGTAADATSLIEKIEYSVNGKDWVGIFSDDRVFDESSEAFAIDLGALKPGEYSVVVRATDSEDNVGTGKVIVTVK